jgi:hypothetical protein
MVTNQMMKCEPRSFTIRKDVLAQFDIQYSAGERSRCVEHLLMDSLQQGPLNMLEDKVITAGLSKEGFNRF